MIESIVTEHRLEEIFDQIPSIVLNSKIRPRTPKFGWGDKYELTKFIIELQGDAYPLIWLLPTPDGHKERGEYCDKRCLIVIATRETDKTMKSSERYRNSFEIVLNPVSDRILQGIESSQTTQNVGDEWDIFRYTDYSEDVVNAQNEIDLWDAILLTVTVRFNKHCINNIKWQKITSKSKK